MSNEEKSNEDIFQEISELRDRRHQAENSEKDEEPESEVSQLKEKLIENNTPLLRSIVEDFTPSELDREDLQEAAYIGLLHAVENYDLNSGAKFSTYAKHLMKGEVRHQVRDNQSFDIKISDAIKKSNDIPQQEAKRIYFEKLFPEGMSEQAETSQRQASEAEKKAINSFSFKKVKQLDEHLEKLERRVRDYLLQNDIEHGNEIDTEVFDIYDEVKELRTSLNVAIDELDEQDELDQGLRQRIWEKLVNLGLLEEAGTALTIWNLIEKILKLFGK